MSADGRYVAFSSSASNLVPGDTNGQADVFVRDRVSGITERVSVNSAGVQGDGPSAGPSISADGRFVAFSSDAQNLSTGDTNGDTDIFLHDRLSGTTVRVSVDSTGAVSDGKSQRPSISADGRYVAFDSDASDLIGNDVNGSVVDIFVHDCLSGTTEVVSLTSTGSQGNGGSIAPSISGDGSLVAFMSVATNLVAGDTNGSDDIFVRNRVNGVTVRVNVDSSGAQAGGVSYTPSLSLDGRFVTFASEAANLVASDSNGADDVFVHDRQTGVTELVSLASSGVQGDSHSISCGPISADGRFVAFSSDSTNLVVGDTNGARDCFVRDRQNYTTERISLDWIGGQANGSSYATAICADGRFVAFLSSAPNLVVADTNGTSDVFIRDRGPRDCNGNGVDDSQDIQSGSSLDCDSNGIPDECDLAAGGSAADCDSNGVIDACDIVANPSLDLDHNGALDSCQNAGTPYCFGDGSGHACPCDPGQIGSTGHGCANSSGEGAILSATGAVSVTGDSLQLHIANMPNPSSVLFFQGTLQQNGGLGSFNGDGLICANGAGGGLIRLGAHGGQPGSSSFGAGVGSDPLISVRGSIPAIGGTRYYQAWYRDNASFCTTAHYNFSNGVAIVWAP